MSARLVTCAQRSKHFEFRRTHKHTIAGNHRPQIRVVDPAIRRRLHLIPFSARFEGERADRNMPAKLKAEGAAILAWAIRGCLAWRQIGLAAPKAVAAASRDYMDAQDTLGMWVEERCDASDPDAETRSGTLYGDFKRWKETRGEHAPSQMRFSGQLEQRFKKSRHGGNVHFHGITLNAGARA